MNKVLKFFTAGLLIVLLFSACSLFLIQNETSSDPVSVFEYFWNDINEHYVFLELKSIDWDEVYDTYKPQISATMTDEELFSVLSDMMNELEDGHCNLMAPFSRSHYKFYSDSPSNFNMDIISDTIEDVYYTGGLYNGFITREEGKFGYIYYGSFMDILTDYDLNYVISRFEDAKVKGILLDIRNNGGGMILNVDLLLSYFTENEVDIYKTYTKTDPTTYEYTGTASILPAENNYLGPVSLLTNRYCFSAASFTATGFKAIESVVQVGDQTGGGMGLPTGAELPNGWEYRISTTVNLAADFTVGGDINDPVYNFEKGVPADVVMDMSSGDELNGIDSIIEAGITSILERQ